MADSRTPLLPPAESGNGASSPHADQPELERWNSSCTNAARYIATLYSFTVMGMNDGALGVSSQPIQC